MLGNVSVGNNGGGVRLSRGLVGECAGRLVGEIVARERGVCRGPYYHDLPVWGVCAQEAVCCWSHHSRNVSSASLLWVRDDSSCLGVSNSQRYSHFFRFLTRCLGNGCAGEEDILAPATRHSPGAIVALDLKGAFDNVSHKAILHKLTKTGRGERMYNYIADFLSYRRAITKIGDVSSDPITLGDTGTPQRSVLSPILFNIAKLQQACCESVTMTTALVCTTARAIATSSACIVLSPASESVQRCWFSTTTVETAADLPG